MCLIGMIRLRSNEHQLHLKNKDFEKKSSRVFYQEHKQFERILLLDINKSTGRVKFSPRHSRLEQKQNCAQVFDNMSHKSPSSFFFFFFLYLTTFSAVCKSLFSLLLVIPTDHTICFRAPPVTCSALYPNIHTVYSRPSLFSTPLVICMHPASLALLPSSMLCVGLHSSLRWNCLPSHESSPCNTLVCDVSVCMCECVVFSLFFFSPLMVLPCSAVKLGPQWEFRKGIIEAVTLWIWGVVSVYHTALFST